MILVDWENLAKINELKDYFEADFIGFRERIEYHILALENIDAKELDKLALLRVLEVTNGCTQWGFRRKDQHCLSVEKTRECMNTVMGFILSKRIDLPSGESISFAKSTEQLMDEVRELYHNAFKKHHAGSEREFYARSTAIFLVCGYERLEVAMQIVNKEFVSLFTKHYLDKGRKYITPYIEAIVP